MFATFSLLRWITNIFFFLSENGHLPLVIFAANKNIKQKKKTPKNHRQLRERSQKKKQQNFCFCLSAEKKNTHTHTHIFVMNDFGGPSESYIIFPSFHLFLSFLTEKFLCRFVLYF
jgi:hypothetical protein